MDFYELEEELLEQRSPSPHFEVPIVGPTLNGIGNHIEGLCQLCHSSLVTKELESFVGARMAFKASMQKYQMAENYIAVSPYQGGNLLETKRIKFGVTSDPILGQENCMLFRSENNYLIHVYCTVPQKNHGSLEWMTADEMLWIECGGSFAVEAFSMLGSMLFEIDLISPSVGPHPETMLMTKQEQPAKVEDFVFLSPQLDHTACTVCSDQRQTIECVAAYTFKCVLTTGSKNLRAHPNSIDIESSEAMLNGSKLRFKIYADTTIRRGRKANRRQCFVFNVGPCIVHISPQEVGRRCLKWLDDQVPEFLAMEAGLGYSLRVFSHQSGLDIKMQPCMTAKDNQRIAEWNKVESTSAVSSAWTMEPAIWNVSLSSISPPEGFHIVFTSVSEPLPTFPPTIVFEGVDVTVVRPRQYDWRHRRSFVVEAPRLISTQRAARLLEQKQYVQEKTAIRIIDHWKRVLWTGTFFFEAGVPPLPTDNHLQSTESVVLSVYYELPGLMHTLQVDTQETVMGLKRKLREQFNTYVALSQDILFKGRLLHANATLGECQVANGDVIYLRERFDKYAVVRHIYGHHPDTLNVYLVTLKDETFIAVQFFKRVLKKERQAYFDTMRKLDQAQQQITLPLRDVFYEEKFPTIPRVVVMETASCGSMRYFYAHHDATLSASDRYSLIRQLVHGLSTLRSMGFFCCWLSLDVVSVDGKEGSYRLWFRNMNTFSLLPGKEVPPSTLVHLLCRMGGIEFSSLSRGGRLENLLWNSLQLGTSLAEIADQVADHCTVCLINKRP